MIETKVAFLEGRLISSQSEQFENISESSDWLEKSRPSKKTAFVLIVCKQTIYLACLHDQNKSGFFGKPAFFQPIRPF